MRHLLEVLRDYSYHCTRDTSVVNKSLSLALSLSLSVPGDRSYKIAVAGNEAAWNATGRGGEAGGIRHIQKVRSMAGMLRPVWAGQDSTLAFLVLTACWWPRR